MLVVERDLESDGSLLHDRAVAQRDVVRRAAARFRDGPLEGLRRWPERARDLHSERNEAVGRDVVALGVLLALRGFGRLGRVARRRVRRGRTLARPGAL